MKYTLFLSYAHAHTKLVVSARRLIALAAGAYAEEGSHAHELIFMDTHSLEPGTNWRTGIEQAISQCRLMLVFWCSHAATSEEISRELSHAVSQGIKIVPILLDTTPLPSSLADIHSIELPVRHTKGPRKNYRNSTRCMNLVVLGANRPLAPPFYFGAKELLHELSPDIGFSATAIELCLKRLNQLHPSARERTRVRGLSDVL